MTVFRLILAASLPLISHTAVAQASEQNFDEIDIIALPSQAPDKPSLSLNWTCDAIVLSSSQRYRPNTCVERGRKHDQAEELDVETITLEQSPSKAGPSRKGR